MKKHLIHLLGVIVATAALCGFNNTVFAQTNSSLISKFLDAAQASSDTKLGSIASELTGKVEAFGATLGTNAAAKEQIDGMLQSLAGGKDSDALASAYKLVSAAKLTPEQMNLAKQVGNLASAYVVQKNFASLEGAQGNVATIVSSLRAGQITTAIPAIKNVATNAHLTEGQKTLITKVADKYAPGWKKAGELMNGLKKLPGF